MPLSFKLKASIFFLCSAVLITGCDTSTPEESQAKRINYCKEMISELPITTDNLTGKEMGEAMDYNDRWERCRAMVEDNFLAGEKERLPDYDESIYAPFKLGGRFYIAPKKYSGTGGIKIPYKWKYGYIEYDLEQKKDVFRPPEHRNGVFFGMHSTRNLAYQKGIAKTDNYDVACENIEYDPTERAGGFIWNGILFSPWLGGGEDKGDNRLNRSKEWQEICPIAVEAVINNLEIFELQPEATVIPPKIITLKSRN